MMCYCRAHIFLLLFLIAPKKSHSRAILLTYKKRVLTQSVVLGVTVTVPDVLQKVLGSPRADHVEGENKGDQK